MVWTSDEVREFLKSKGFSYSRYKGDDEYWVNKSIQAIVLVPQRNEDIIFDTLSWMVRRSKIPKKEWNDWKKNKS